MLPGQPVPDDVLVRYLLGELPDDEAERLDEQSVVDEDFAARLRLVEDDLVDSYASGRLNSERRKRFESYYLASPRRREKTSFARQLQAAVDGDLVQRHPTAAGSGRPAAPWGPWAAAAAVVLCLGSGWLFVQDTRLRAALTDTERRLADADRQTTALTTELAVQQRAAAAAQASLAQPPDTQSVTAIALVLLPQTRGVGPVPIVAIGADSRMVPIALAIETPQRAPFEAALRDPATNAIVWRSAPIAAVRAQPAPLVTVAIPAGHLKAQHYAIDLFAGGRSAADFAGSYAFEVVRR